MIKRFVQICSIPCFSIALFAQGPPPGGRMHGPGMMGGPFGIMGAGPASGAPVTGAPYSAVQMTQFQDTLADGNQISRQNQAKVYRDSQGRVRTERTFTPRGSTTAETSVVIYDPVGGFVYVLNPANSTAFKRPIPANAANGHAPRQPHEPAGATVTTDNLGTQTVNGLPATGTKTTVTIAAGAIGNAQPIQRVREVWISTDLKVPVLIKNTDPINGNTVTQLTNVIRSEPDASLFQVPSSYTVKSRAEGGFGRGFGGGRAHVRSQGQQQQ